MFDLNDDLNTKYLSKCIMTKKKKQKKKNPVDLNTQLKAFFTDSRQ